VIRATTSVTTAVSPFMMLRPMSEKYSMNCSDAPAFRSLASAASVVSSTGRTTAPATADKQSASWSRVSESGPVNVSACLPQSWPSRSSTATAAISLASIRLGVGETQLHHELFGGRAGICGRHTLTVGTQTVDVEGYPSLLAAMDGHGIPVVADCRAGHCGLCRRRIVSGDVIHGPALACEVKAGECLPCVAIPLTDLELAAPCH